MVVMVVMVVVVVVLGSDSIGRIVFVFVVVVVVVVVVIVVARQQVRVRVSRVVVSKLYALTAMDIDLVGRISRIRLASLFFCSGYKVHHIPPLFGCRAGSYRVHIIIGNDNSAICSTNKFEIRQDIGYISCNNDFWNNTVKCFEIVARLCQKRCHFSNPRVVAVCGCQYRELLIGLIKWRVGCFGVKYARDCFCDGMVLVVGNRDRYIPTRELLSQRVSITYIFDRFDMENTATPSGSGGWERNEDDFRKGVG